MMPETLPCVYVPLQGVEAVHLPIVISRQGSDWEIKRFFVMIGVGIEQSKVCTYGWKDQIEQFAIFKYVLRCSAQLADFLEKLLPLKVKSWRPIRTEMGCCGAGDEEVKRNGCFPAAQVPRNFKGQ